MNRLTKRHGKHAVQIGGETRRNDVGWLRLADYEDMEEQGRLIEQKQGYWIKSRKYYDDGYTVIGACSICGLEFQAKLLRKICYCPHCGAKMLTKEEAEAKLQEVDNEHVLDKQ